MSTKLGEICNFQSGGTPSKNNSEFFDGTIPWVTTTSLNGSKIDERNAVTWITEKAIKESAAKIVPANSIMVGTRVGVGKVAINTVEMSTSQDIISLLDIDEERWDKDYLCKFLQSKSAYLNSQARGATIKGIKINVLADLEVPDISLKEQCYISKVLNIVAELMNARQQQLAKLDELVKARFVEMFGDPVSNSLHLPEKKLAELGEFGRGVSKHRPRNDPALLGGKYPLIQTGEVASADVYITSYQNSYSELGFQQSKLWKKGTLCITIAANIAKTAILGFDACFPDSVVGFNANEKTNEIFIHYWFSFFQAILEAQAPESAQKNINLKILGDLKVIVPDISAQTEFVSFVIQIEKTKLSIQRSLEQIETLKKALMQQYFG